MRDRARVRATGARTGDATLDPRRCDRLVRACVHGRTRLGLQEPRRRQIRPAPSGERAARIAFRSAGLSPTDVDVAELYDPFSFEIIRQLEVFGFCDHGEGGSFVADGHIAEGGRLPVTTDGGTMSFSHAGIAAQQLQRVIRAAEQIRGTCSSHQVSGARVAICSNGGSGASVHRRHASRVRRAREHAQATAPGNSRSQPLPPLEGVLGRCKTRRAHVSTLHDLRLDRASTVRRLRALPRQADRDSRPAGGPEASTAGPSYGVLLTRRS